MPSFTTRLADGWQRAQGALPLALVPAVVSLLATDKIGKVLAFDGRHIGLRIGLPAGIVDLWQFVSVPNEGVSIGVAGTDLTPVGLAVILIAVVIRAGLMAGYFGSLREALATDSYDFMTNLERHFLPFLVYTLLPVLVLAPLLLVSGRGGLPSVVVVLVPVVIAVSYLFYATPYLIVLRGVGVLEAATGSYRLAVAGGPYLRFAAGFAGLVVGGSILATAVVVNLGAIGVALGFLGAAPVGLACNLATMRFIADIDPESPTLRAWNSDGSADASDPEI